MNSSTTDLQQASSANQNAVQYLSTTSHRTCHTYCCISDFVLLGLHWLFICFKKLVAPCLQTCLLQTLLKTFNVVVFTDSLQPGHRSILWSKLQPYCGVVTEQNRGTNCACTEFVIHLRTNFWECCSTWYRKHQHQKLRDYRRLHLQWWSRNSDADVLISIPWTVLPTFRRKVRFWPRWCQCFSKFRT